MFRLLRSTRTRRISSRVIMTRTQATFTRSRLVIAHFRTLTRSIFRLIQYGRLNFLSISRHTDLNRHSRRINLTQRRNQRLGSITSFDSSHDLLELISINSSQRTRNLLSILRGTRTLFRTKTAMENRKKAIDLIRANLRRMESARFLNGLCMLFTSLRHRITTFRRIRTARGRR